MDTLKMAQKKKKKGVQDEKWIIDEDSDHPIHENHVKQGKQKQA